MTTGNSTKLKDVCLLGSRGAARSGHDDQAVTPLPRRLSSVGSSPKPFQNASSKALIPSQND